MTNAKHTPGPWRFEPHDGYIPDDWGVEPVQVVGADGTVIACNTAFYPTALDPANARLIAAAPDMLEALKAVDALGMLNPTGSGTVEDAARAVKAAIARAEERV